MSQIILLSVKKMAFNSFVIDLETIKPFLSSLIILLGLTKDRLKWPLQKTQIFIMDILAKTSFPLSIRDYFHLIHADQNKF